MDERLLFLVADRIELEMVRQSISQRRLAELAGVSEGTIRRILDGKDTRLSTLEAIATVLGVGVEDLVRAA